MAKTNVVLPKGEYLLLVLLAVFTFSILLTGYSIAVEPNGANISTIRSERANTTDAGSHQAQAGNITELNVFSYSTTQSWQGYFGNVSGTIQLADAGSNVLYNWSLAEPQGEIYASTNTSITWTNIQCFNFTATGAYSGSETPGEVNLYGTNLSILESSFGIESDDVDGVDETFTLQHGGAGEHDQFFTANREFSEGECVSTRVFSDAGTGESDKFEQVILYEPTSASVIFASLIEPGTVAGFDGNDYDFQMLVLEDGHGTNVDTTTYYFYVELE